MRLATYPGFDTPKLRAAVKRMLLVAGIGLMRRLPSGKTPPVWMLRVLRLGWGNRGFSARLTYLQAVARAAAATPGPVLECGTGLTTLVLGVVAGEKRGVNALSLEDDEACCERITGTLARRRVKTVTVCRAQTVRGESCEWYDTTGCPFPDDPFSLVVCDGPVESTFGGRCGLVPVMDDRLSPDCIVLLDDYGVEKHRDLVARWKNHRPDLTVDASQKASFAAIRLGPRERTQPEAS